MEPASCRAAPRARARATLRKRAGRTLSRFDPVHSLPPSLRRPVAEGWAIIAPLLAAALALRRWPQVSAALVAAALLVGAALRDPERPPPETDDALAPADGRVVAVDQVWDDHLNAPMLEIAIFLALWHVHVQRAPLAGRVIATRSYAGSYLPALWPGAAGNYREATYLDTAWGPCAVTQIAGLLARRIVRWVDEGDTLRQGQRLGMIKFGSRVTLRLPAGSEPLVSIGEEVRASVTP
ncbi:MAG TPA: phosphatidylserine decarboxylase, partial [Solirubrobacteraceae bacterium]|nr:phosphatidylserine decarboxylase [Solirubrobacteraceae bacterium]